jgi:hypothetical protein
VCGDRDCGAVLADVVIAPGSVTWTNWQFTDSKGTKQLHALSPYIFDHQVYEALVRSAPATVAAVPYDEQLHVSRRLLWPWQWGWRLPRRDA